LEELCSSQAVHHHHCSHQPMLSVKTNTQSVLSASAFEYTQCLKKLCHCNFVNNSVKHWPNLIIFGMQHCEETRHKWPQFCPPNLNTGTVGTLPYDMQK